LSTDQAPVNHPDSLILLNRTHSVGLPAAPSSFKVQQEAYSLTTARLVSTCETELVIYDYNAVRPPALLPLRTSLLLSRQRGSRVDVLFRARSGSEPKSSDARLFQASLAAGDGRRRTSRRKLKALGSMYEPHAPGCLADLPTRMI
jgi:hypothetical protein